MVRCTLCGSDRQDWAEDFTCQECGGSCDRARGVRNAECYWDARYGAWVEGRRLAGQNVCRGKALAGWYSAPTPRPQDQGDGVHNVDRLAFRLGALADRAAWSDAPKAWQRWLLDAHMATRTAYFWGVWDRARLA